MKKILLLCLLLFGCSNHYYGLGLAKTEEANASYGSRIRHKSFGIGVFQPYSNTYYFCAGYTEIYIKNIDANKVARILQQEKEIIQ